MTTPGLESESAIRFGAYTIAVLIHVPLVLAAHAIGNAVATPGPARSVVTMLDVPSPSRGAAPGSVSTPAVTVREPGVAKVLDGGAIGRIVERTSPGAAAEIATVPETPSSATAPIAAATVVVPEAAQPVASATTASRAPLETSTVEGATSMAARVADIVPQAATSGSAVEAEIAVATRIEPDMVADLIAASEAEPTTSAQPLGPTEAGRIRLPAILSTEFAERAPTPRAQGARIADEGAAARIVPAEAPAPPRSVLVAPSTLAPVARQAAQPTNARSGTPNVAASVASAAVPARTVGVSGAQPSRVAVGSSPAQTIARTIPPVAAAATPAGTASSGSTRQAAGSSTTPAATARPMSGAARVLPPAAAAIVAPTTASVAATPSRVARSAAIVVPRTSTPAATEATGAPQPGVSGEDIPSGVQRTAAVVDFARGYGGGGDCFAALGSQVSTNGVAVSGFSRDEAAWLAFNAALETKVGFRLATPSRLISDAQCAALGFARDLPAYPDFRMRIALQSDHVRTGTEIRGRIEDAGPGPVALLVVDDEGRVLDATSILGKAEDGRIAFSTPLTLTAAPVTTVQLLVALSGPGMTEALRPRAPVPAALYFETLKRALAGSGSLDVAIAAFTLE